MMIRNRLAELLSERQLKITKVAKDTGISRNTITSTSQNDTKMIQYETIDTLCQYLGITPNDFFDYIPIKYSLNCDTIKFNYSKTRSQNKPDFVVIDTLKYTFALKIDIETSSLKKSFEFEGKFEVENLDDPAFETEIDVSVEFKNNEEYEEFKKMFYDKASAGHKTLFNKEVRECIIKAHENALEEEIEESFYLLIDIKDYLKFSKLPWEYEFLN